MRFEDAILEILTLIYFRFVFLKPAKNESDVVAIKTSGNLRVDVVALRLFYGSLPRRLSYPLQSGAASSLHQISGTASLSP